MRIFCYTLLLLAVSAIAGPIELPTTGTTRPGATGIGAQQDANYSVSYASSTSTAALGVALPAYIATIIDPKWANAPWITPTADGMQDLPGGIYSYAVHFDLPANTTSISGSLYADDRVSVYFNGRLICDLPDGNGSGYWPTALSNFAITNSFLVGLNTLEFRVNNTNPNTPTGLAVTKLTANVGAASVPEPISLLLLGTGLVGLAAISKKKGACK